ncbi:lantibiotic ABC transporter ATP-binding protein, partial [Bacillus cereus group sp. Bce025]
GVLGYQGKLNKNDDLEDLFVQVAGKYRREA